MFRIIECITEAEFNNRNKGFIKLDSQRILRVNIETNMTDFDREEVVKSKIENLMQAARDDEYVRIGLSIVLIDSLSGKKFEEGKIFYARALKVKEKYEKYNNDRNTSHVIKDLLSGIVERSSSFVSISDAMEMLGIDKEDSAQYLTKEGDYQYPDLVGRWASMFSKGNNV